MSYPIKVSEPVRTADELAFSITINIRELSENEKFIEMIGEEVGIRLSQNWEYSFLNKTRETICNRAIEMLSATFLTDVVNKIDVDAVAKIATIEAGKVIGRDTGR